MFIYLKWNNCACELQLVLPVTCETITCNLKCEQVSGPCKGVVLIALLPLKIALDSVHAYVTRYVLLQTS